MSDSGSSGAVYIFRGAKSLNDIKLSQIIQSKEIAEQLRIDNINRFGSSISGGLDIDSNNYPDLTIGAYKSNMIFTLLTRPVLNINAAIKNIAQLQSIDHTSSNCANQRVCFQLNFCLTLRDTNRNTNNALLKQTPVKYKLIGDTKIKYARISFKNDVKTNVYENRLSSIDNKCDLINVYLQDAIDDTLTSIKFDVKLEIDDNYNNISIDNANFNDVNRYPILNKDYESFSYEVI